MMNETERKAHMKTVGIIRNTVPMRTAKTGYIFSSAILFILGLLLVISPETGKEVFADIQESLFPPNISNQTC